MKFQVEGYAVGRRGSGPYKWVVLQMQWHTAQLCTDAHAVRPATSPRCRRQRRSRRLGVLIPGHQCRHTKAVGTRLVSRDTHRIAARSTVIEKSLYCCGQRSIHHLTAQGCARQKQVLAEDLLVLAEIF